MFSLTRPVSLTMKSSCRVARIAEHDPIPIGRKRQSTENIGFARFLDYINTGSTSIVWTSPISPCQLENAHRLITFANVPGIPGKINHVLAEHGINIAGAIPKTNETIGYVITDINKRIWRAGNCTGFVRLSTRSSSECCIENKIH